MIEPVRFTRTVDGHSPEQQCQHLDGRASSDDRDGRPVVVLLVGLTGSGKSTWATRYAASEGLVRLSVDDRLAERHGRYGIDYPEPEHGRLEAPIAAEVDAELRALIGSGRSVILDRGLWLRRDRDRYKQLIIDAGGTWRLLYFQASKDVLLDRLAERNIRARTDPAILTITPDALDDFYQRFEPPSGEGEELLVQR